MYGMAIAVTDKEHASSTQRVARTQPVARVRNQEACCRGYGINF